MGIKAVFDTNILIDYLAGYREAKEELALYEQPQISIITKMEILVGADSSNNDLLLSFLDYFQIVALIEPIASVAIDLRRKYKIKLPDAIIWATARHSNALLITRNTKDFSVKSSDIKVPYHL